MQDGDHNMYYKLNNQNQVETSPDNLPNWSGYNLYLASLSIQDRQNLGWFKNVVETDIETAYTDSENDTVYIPRKIETPIPETPFEFSPLKMEIAIEQRGKELGFGGLGLLDSIIEQAGMTRAYKRASVLDSGDERVVQLMSVVAQAFSWTKEELFQYMLSWKI